MENDEVKNHLARVLASPAFKNAGRTARFLNYIVDKTLAGEGDAIKGYTLGLEVFDRDVDFDPAIDSIVRVEAGRLRSKLLEYYTAEGRTDRLRIELPKGRYKPDFISLTADTAVEPCEQKSTAQRSRSGRPVIAVLPLASIGTNEENEIFAEGMTDALISRLSGNTELDVISRTSVMHFKGSDAGLTDIASRLNADFVLEGSCLRDAEEMRLSVQLVDGHTDIRVWSETYERPVSGVLALQRELAGHVSVAIGQSIVPSPHVGVADKEQVNVRAFEEYLLGKHSVARLTSEGYQKALAHFDESLKIMPDFAPAFCGMANCYCGMGSHGTEFQRPSEVIPRGIEYAEKAIALDPQQAEARAFLSIMLLKYRWDWPGARREVETALSLNPSDSRARWQYSLYFETLGDFEHSVRQAELAIQIDPLSAMTNFNLGWQYYQAGEMRRSATQFERNRVLNPDFWGNSWGLGHIYRMEGDLERAETEFQSAVDSRGGHILPFYGLAYTQARSGKVKQAREILQHLTELSHSEYVSPYYLAVIHAGLGNEDAMYEELERAFEERARSMAWLAVAGEFRPWQDDTRMQSLFERIGVPVSVTAV